MPQVTARPRAARGSVRNVSLPGDELLRTASPTRWSPLRNLQADQIWEASPSLRVYAGWTRNTASAVATGPYQQLPDFRMAPVHPTGTEFPDQGPGTWKQEGPPGGHGTQKLSPPSSSHLSAGPLDDGAAGPLAPTSFSFSHPRPLSPLLK